MVDIERSLSSKSKQEDSSDKEHLSGLNGKVLEVDLSRGKIKEVKS